MANKLLARLFFFLTLTSSMMLTSSLSAKSTFDHSHSLWDKLLKKYVEHNEHYNRFDYKNLKKNMSELTQYTQSLSSVTKKDYKKFSRDEKLAFLINSYNAFTVKVIVERYPIKSIRNIGLLSLGPWWSKNIPFLESKFSLHMIEKDYMINKFQEARIHFAINCASIGCPSLQSYAFVASKLNQQLEESTQEFATNKHRYTYDKSDNKLNVSKIFDWYEDDFNRQYGSVPKFFAQYLKNAKLKSAQVSYNYYDWKLNKK